MAQTKKETRVARATTKKTPLYAGKLPFKVGDGVFVRTVTHHQVGRVIAITPTEIVLDDASWVAEDGRFSEALATGKLNEVEQGPGWCVIGRGAVVDIWPWNHALPVPTK